MFGNESGLMIKKGFSILLVLLSLFSSGETFAQTTKVRGRIVDAETGEALPFVGVFFKNTTIGITTDLDGYYTLEVRDVATDTLCAVLLSYDPQEKIIQRGQLTNMDFALVPSNTVLAAATVKPDNSRIRRMLEDIDRHRSRNNPEKRKAYSCDVYNKMEMDLTNAREQLTNKRFLKEFGFVFDYLDTSVVSGVEYLPVMISESVSRRRHTSDPDFTHEDILANQVSGVEDENLLAEFMGSMYFKANFYDNFINAFNVEIPSPINPSGLLFYNYYIVDSLKVDGRKTYVVRYHPKKGISTPSFDGEMQIDAEEFAIRKIHAKLKHGMNINWVRDLVLDAENVRYPDSTWFYKQAKIYADFSVTMRDSSKMISFLGNRLLEYSNPSFEEEKDEQPSYKVTVADNVTNHDEEYWRSVRPYALTQKEQNIFNMVDSIKEAPLYQDLYSLVYTLINGYYKVRKFEFGPYSKVISFNNLEGARLRMGVRTSKDFSSKYRFMLYGAYGFKDHEFKGGGSAEFLFSKMPTSKLTLSVSRDVFQLGRSTSNFTDGNILASILGKGNAQKYCPLLDFSALYEHEFNSDVNTSLGFSTRRFYSNRFIPMQTFDGRNVKYVGANEVHGQLRLSREETVNRGFFVKRYWGSNYPVFTFDLAGSFKGLGPNTYSYFRPEFSIDWKFNIAPIGRSRIHFNTGAIIGQVPYPLLHLHEGNGTYIMDRLAFSCMDFFEFASDKWVTLMYDHNFYGFFLGKIPLLKRLKLREVVTFKATYGGLSNKNNALLPKSQAPLKFPMGMETLGKIPYMEAGVGLTNIFTIFRIDAIWRLTHREKVIDGQTVAAHHNFALTFGLDLNF